MSKFLSIMVAGLLGIQSLLVPVSVMAQTSTTTPTPQLIWLARQLRQGLSGDDVKLLQTLLSADLSVYPEGLVTGFFGRKTAEAVKRFQKKNGLPIVGIVGPLTREKLKKHGEEQGLSEEKDTNDDNHNGDRNERHICVIIPPGHEIAPGWRKKHEGERELVRECRKDKGDDHRGNGTSTPPVISNVMATSTTANSTNINWTTNEFATSWIWYGTSTPLLNFNGNNITTKNHSVNLIGLSASTTYQFIAVSKDSSGNTATSSQQSFMTN